jgi:hypothetical protein
MHPKAEVNIDLVFVSFVPTPDLTAQLNGWSRSAQFGSGFQQAGQSGMCKTRHPRLYLRDDSHSWAFWQDPASKAIWARVSLVSVSRRG